MPQGSDKRRYRVKFALELYMKAWRGSTGIALPLASELVGGGFLLFVIRARSQGFGCTAAIRLIVHPVF
jgi:hypothetical protein